jgi:hypothetical protein
VGFTAQRDLLAATEPQCREENRLQHGAERVDFWTGDPAINGTMFLALTDLDLDVTPCTLTMINPHVAALAL